MIEWDEQTDIVIIGSGLAGLSAAIEANQAGASVIVFEKMNLTGGNTRIADGAVAAPNNYLQKKRGIEDSPELLYEDMIKAGLGLNHPDLVKVVAEKATEALLQARRERFDLVITDMKMPDMDGIALLEKIKEKDPELPVMMMTAHGTVDKAVDAMQKGAYTFILKATKEVPRRLMHPKRKTIGLRVPDNAITQALLAELGEPLMSCSLIMPGEAQPLTDPYDIRDTLEHQVELVIDGGFTAI